MLIFHIQIGNPNKCRVRIEVTLHVLVFKVPGSLPGTYRYIQDTNIYGIGIGCQPWKQGFELKSRLVLDLQPGVKPVAEKSLV